MAWLGSPQGMRILGGCIPERGGRTGLFPPWGHGGERCKHGQLLTVPVPCPLPAVTPSHCRPPSPTGNISALRCYPLSLTRFFLPGVDNQRLQGVLERALGDAALLLVPKRGF